MTEPPTRMSLSSPTITIIKDQSKKMVGFQRLEMDMLFRLPPVRAVYFVHVPRSEACFYVPMHLLQRTDRIFQMYIDFEEGGWQTLRDSMAKLGLTCQAITMTGRRCWTMDVFRLKRCPHYHIPVYGDDAPPAKRTWKEWWAGTFR